MSAQKTKPTAEAATANEVRLVGRVSQATRGAGAPERRQRVDVPGGGRPATGSGAEPADAWTRSSARAWTARARRSAAAWSADDVVEVSRRAAPTVLPLRCRGRLSGGGRDDLRPAHSAGSARMSTPTLGFGWNDVAFSGSSRSAAAMLSTCSKLGAGIRIGDAVRPLDRSQRLVGRVMVPDRARWSGQARDQVLVQHLDRGPVRADVDLEGDPVACRRWPPADPGRACRGRARVGGLPPRCPPRSAASCSAVRVVRPSTRWMAPRKSGVSSWSTSIARPASVAGPGCCCCIRR